MQEGVEEVGARASGALSSLKQHTVDPVGQAVGGAAHAVGSSAAHAKDSVGHHASRARDTVSHKGDDLLLP